MNAKYIVKLFYHNDAEYYGSEDIITGTCVLEPLPDYATTFETQEKAQDYINKHTNYLLQYDITQAQIIEIKSTAIQEINMKEGI